jgi:hypothetical protein
MIKIFILLIVFIFLAFLLNINKNETFSNVQLKCGLHDNSGSTGSLVDVLSNGDSSDVNTQLQLKTVDPALPECVGICINQHTYTTDNTKNIIVSIPNLLGKIKDNQSNENIISTKCGECINNFYQGLTHMKSFT